ncbi:MAG: GHMP kinase [Candidatus Coatesbacteria bacterium]|nr:GHMP kinase [Candidatus Coatesbacteria bacterium]
MISKSPFSASPTVSMTPVRISFGGGGTDLEAFYSKHDGLVVSATIDKYFYCIASKRTDGKLVLSSADYDLTEEHDTVEDVDTYGLFGLIKAVVRSFTPPFGVHIHTASDIPPGSGLGLSGAATVGAIKAVSAMLGKRVPLGAIAELASTIEIDRLKRPIGKQDQYASAFGGLNEIRFLRDEVTVAPLLADGRALRELGNWTMLFFTGKSRDSATILSEQRGRTAQGHQDTMQLLLEIREHAQSMKSAIAALDFVRLGELIDASWQAKRRIVSTISSARIDELYDQAKRSGAIGGKITGAGGGGFLMLVCPPEKRAAVSEALAEMGVSQLPFRFVSRGTHIAR